MVRVGCCGFPVSMKKYFETFDVVEVQKTFYNPPKVETARKWRKEAPEGFEFTVKAWQLITHPPSSPTYRKAGIKVEDAGFFKPIKVVFEAWERTREVAKALEAKFLLFQTPKSFTDSEENVKNMREFFGSIEREFVFGFEPRGWSRERILKVCEELDLVHVVDPFVEEQLYGDIIYYRLHGEKGYRHKYSDEELERLRDMCVKEGYVMFNNVHMFDDAQRFKKLLEAGNSRQKPE
ncbi:MAG: DUF72 domain-containing protein [Archaeoglobaceae archaeon]